MTRQQLEHVIRAAAATVNTRDIVVIGSQAILGSVPDAPAELTVSLDADVFPRDDPQLSVVVEGSIGELSMFHSTFGYYAHGVDDGTAVLPNGWRERLVKVSTPATMGAVGWCLEPHDLAVSKLAAGREKDYEFVDALLRRGIVSDALVRDRLGETPAVDPQRRTLAVARLDSWASGR
jgi:hypothetical protein